MTIEKYARFCLMNLLASSLTLGVGGAAPTDSLENDFRELPMSARRLTGPLFWLHGDESAELLSGYVDKVAEGGNGCFTAESRPHADWLGPGWYRDLAVCLEAAKRNDLRMWIFDERWWPSGEVGGKVPREFGSKELELHEKNLTGPGPVILEIPSEHRVAVVAGRNTMDGIQTASLVDLSDLVQDDNLYWEVPAGSWKVMTFTWRFAERRGGPLVDGASRDAVDWYLETVYQPHYDRFASDFGETIVGYFYDEPETHGDWGTEVIGVLRERGVDWKAALVAWKAKLAGETQVAYRYQYGDALAEAWGRTMYGGIEEWCREHRVESIGHFLEHSNVYLSQRACAGNMFQLQKYSSMGAIDAVFDQFVMGSRVERDAPTWQTPKIASSISHAYGKRDDLAMVEIFGARGQDLTYREMKWWTDHMQVSGVNFMIPHSFNPRSPNDTDCPPYFYNNGKEPRWPLYRVYADYTSRLSLMLSGGRHVCPVAFLFLGQSFHCGEAIAPDGLSAALQDALYDCDWLPYEVFEQDVRIDGRALCLREEAYRVLVVPAAEVIPYETLVRAREFLEAGGVVVGYGILPRLSATPDKGSREIGDLREAIWGAATEPSTKVRRRSGKGGRSYFLPAAPTPAQLEEVLAEDAGVRPTLEVLDGDTEGWLHVLHRVKEGRDVFFVCNQADEGPAKRFTFRARARGVPEVWDALRGDVTGIAFEREDEGSVRFTLDLEPLESVLLVFGEEARTRPPRREGVLPAALEPIVVERLPYELPPPAAAPERSSLAGCSWIWFAGDGASPPPGRRFFRGVVTVDSACELTAARIELTADNDFALWVNGAEAGSGSGGYEDWRRKVTLDLTSRLEPGANSLALLATNFGEGANPAGVIGRVHLSYSDSTEATSCLDGSWRATDAEQAGWTDAAFDDTTWPLVRVIGKYGDAPWYGFDDPNRRVTLSPVVADPFEGRFTLPVEWVAPGIRLYLELEALELGAAAVELDGEYLGGVIGRPFRLDLTEHLQPGEHSLRIEPRAPRIVRVVAVRD